MLRLIDLMETEKSPQIVGALRELVADGLIHVQLESFVDEVSGETRSPTTPFWSGLGYLPYC